MSLSKGKQVEYASTERLIIGFGHRRRRGKDVAARMVGDELAWLEGEACRRAAAQAAQNKAPPVGRSIIVQGFATALKDGIGRGVLGLSREQLHGDLKTEVDAFWGATPRHLLQQLGTEVMRKAFREDVWVKALARQIENEPEAHFLITDVRFPNEAEMIHRLGGKLIRIDRAVPMTVEDAHASETSLLDYAGWDLIVENNSSLVALEGAICRALRHLFPDYCYWATNDGSTF